ncbi:MAG TPA: hypothetical protein VGO58_10120 [Chitinophagaceae bacterium]|jgi:hypothetical protein|nr:hypothetical protein [Chitinophagaceae bacterium]
MRRYLLLSLLASSVILSSCSKSYEDRIIGSWQLEDAWRWVFLGKDHFQTGYESGIFTFMENGDATYTSSTDTMTGYWRSDRYTNSYYNSDGEYETRTMKYLRISLVNFQQNQRLEWEFDDFHFRDGWQEIRAEQYSLSNNRVYEFERR